MDLEDQLKKIFPDHISSKAELIKEEPVELWMQEDPLICKYEKRNGKPVTLIEGYNGAKSDFKALTKKLQSQLNVGGSYKNEVIMIQGNYRDKIMELLKDFGFQVKRVGG